MRTSFSISILTALVLLTGLSTAGSAVAEQPLRIGGTGSATEMLRLVSAKFTAASQIKVDVIPSLGSSGAIRALGDGVLDIVVSARTLKESESGKGLRLVAVLRTGYVIATSHRNTKGLKAADLPKIFIADKPVWADGSPIRIILRPRSESDTALLGKLFAGLGEAIEVARKRSDIPVAATDQDNVAMAERMPGSLIGTTVTQLKTEKRPLYIVPLDGQQPTLANVESGAYPFVKSMYVFISGKISPEAKQFVEFLRSPKGLTALRETETLLGAE